MKYRYIKTLGKPTSKDLLDWKRFLPMTGTGNIISMIRKKIEDYERLVKKQAEKIEQTQINREKIEQFHKK